jgi:TonB family protein
MLKLISVVSLAVGICAGADFRGGWAGTISEKDAAAPVYLTVSELGQHVSGTLSFAQDEMGAPLQRAEARGDALTFEVRNAAGQLLAFELTFTVTGNPEFADRQVLMEGTAVSSDRHFDVMLYPTREPLGYPQGGRNTMPRVVHKVEPVSPAGNQGTVTLYIHIEPTGMVAADQIRVLPGSEHALEQAAIECVRKWRFMPAFQNGYAVGSRATVEVNFR